MFDDDVESMASESNIQELECQKRTPLKASAAQFEPSGAWGAPMAWNFAEDMHNDPRFSDIYSNRDGNVYMFNLDLMYDDESDSDDEPSKGRALERPVGLGLPIGPPPGLEAVAAWPVHHTPEQQQEVQPSTPWWRQPCPFNAQASPPVAGILHGSLPGQRPWRRSAGHDAARSCLTELGLHSTLTEMVATKVQGIDSCAERDLVKDYSDTEDTDSTRSFKSDSDDVDSE